MQALHAAAARLNARPALVAQRALAARLSSGRNQAAIIQRVKAEELEPLSARMHEKAKSAPSAGANLWKASNHSAVLYLLGVNHSVYLSEMDAAAPLARWLMHTHFDMVRTEMKETIVQAKEDPRLAESVEALIKADKAFREGMKALDSPVASGSTSSSSSTAPESPEQRAQRQKIPRARLHSTRANALGEHASSNVFNDTLDSAYLHLAVAKKHEPGYEPLEDVETRAEAAETNRRAGTLAPDARSAKPTADEQVAIDVAAEHDKQSVRQGNQQVHFHDQAVSISKGTDAFANPEERNLQWLKKIPAAESISGSSAHRISPD